MSFLPVLSTPCNGFDEEVVRGNQGRVSRLQRQADGSR
jgi:hypothetical protein